MSEQTPQPHSPPPDAGPAPRIVTFATQWGCYNAGESAAFNAMDADALIELKVATEGGGGGHPEAEREERERREGEPLPDDVPRVGVMVAGLEFPPRRYLPDPHHYDIPQTYDPSVRHQLERTARDRAAGKPGAAAQEDLDRALDLRKRHIEARAPHNPPPVTDPV
jgi:hypothetical protein